MTIGDWNHDRSLGNRSGAQGRWMGGPEDRARMPEGPSFADRGAISGRPPAIPGGGWGGGWNPEGDWFDRDEGPNYGGGGAWGSEPDRERGFIKRAADEVASWFGDRSAEQRQEMDHRGRGPKGYTRSDARIAEDVNERLSDDNLVDASQIDVQVSGGEVTLAGTVTDRRQRRRAEDCAESVSGVRYVQNDIRVEDRQMAVSSPQPGVSTRL